MKEIIDSGISIIAVDDDKYIATQTTQERFGKEHLKAWKLTLLGNIRKAQQVIAQSLSILEANKEAFDTVEVTPEEVASGKPL